WQIPLGYLFLLILVGLIIRDRLYTAVKSISRSRLLALILALCLAATLTLAFLSSTLPALRLMSETFYPGKRLSLGGDYPPWLLFKGMYNLISIYSWRVYLTAVLLLNQSESSSFYFLFPAVFTAYILSKRLRVALGPIGALVVGHVA